uniref:Uncharacterized protein n=1 Tax=Triticum urartu TaxID=4572 RepID=A0A8R7QPP6_TRIUA
MHNNNYIAFRKRVNEENSHGGYPPSTLLNDIIDDTGTDGLATFTDGKPHSLLTSHRLDELHNHLDTVTRHAHLRLLILVIHNVCHIPRDISSPHVELRTVTRKKWGVPATLLLLEHIHNSLKLGVWRDGTGLCQHHASLNVFLLHTTEQKPNIVPSNGIIHGLLEHLNTSDRGIASLPDADEVDWVPNLDGATLDTASGNCTTTSDGEDILNSEQEG